jgi:hypothetical protein
MSQSGNLSQAMQSYLFFPKRKSFRTIYHNLEQLLICTAKISSILRDFVKNATLCPSFYILNFVCIGFVAKKDGAHSFWHTAAASQLYQAPRGKPMNTPLVSCTGEVELCGQLHSSQKNVIRASTELRSVLACCNAGRGPWSDACAQ